MQSWCCRTTILPRKKIGFRRFGAAWMSEQESIRHLPGPQNKLWRDKDSDRSNFALIENDLTDLRAVKNIVEDFALQLEEAAATIIVNHPRLQASDLSKFRSMLEIMGY